MFSRTLLASSISLVLAPLFAQTIPTSPSVVSIQDSRLVVRKRAPDNTLAPPGTYLVRGVVWSPTASSANAVSAGQDSAVAMRTQFGRKAGLDLPLIKALNANTVRLTIDPGLNADGLAVLDAIYAQGLMAAITVDNGTNDTAHAAAVVNAYKNHPAVLLWMLGDQWNRNLYNGTASSVADAARRTEAAAQLIKSLDSDHPVATSYGDIDVDSPGLRLADTQSYVNELAPSVDLWALDVDRGDTFGTLFQQWRSITNKPVIAGSFGSSRRTAAAMATDATPQGGTLLSLWSDLVRNASAGNSCGVAVGGFASVWNDEASAAAADASVRPASRPHSAYAALQAAFADGFQPVSTFPLTAASVGAAADGKGAARFFRSGTLLHTSAGPARGFNAMTFDPGTGELQGPANFNTVDTGDSGTAATDLINFLANVPAGRVVLLAVSQDAGLNEAGSCKLLGRAWNHNLISTLESLGSTRIANICAGGSWSMVAVKGHGVLDEQIAATAEARSTGTVKMPAVPSGCQRTGTTAATDASGNASSSRTLSPRAVGVGTVTPSSGNGSRQTFTATFDSTGTTISWVEMLIATASDASAGLDYCFVHYDRNGNGFWVYGSGGFFMGPVTPGNLSNQLLNQFCALSTKNSTVSFAGNTLTVNMEITFKKDGDRKIFLRAYDNSNVDTGWVQKGTWTAVHAPFASMSVSPNTGGGNGTQTFTVTDPAMPGYEGADTFTWVQFLIAAGDKTGAFCFVHYDRPGNALWMYDQSLHFFVGPVTPGEVTGGLNSPACFIDTQHTTVNKAGGNVVLAIPITLKAPLAGARTLFQRETDEILRDTDWIATGTWTVP